MPITSRQVHLILLSHFRWHECQNPWVKRQNSSRANITARSVREVQQLELGGMIKTRQFGLNWRRCCRIANFPDVRRRCYARRCYSKRCCVAGWKRTKLKWCCQSSDNEIPADANWWQGPKLVPWTNYLQVGWEEAVYVLQFYNF